jgi:hypothetical protein
MPVTVAMYDNALDLDIAVQTFGRDGKFLIDGESVAPGEVEVDYLWLSHHIHNGDCNDSCPKRTSLSSPAR